MSIRFEKIMKVKRSLIDILKISYMVSMMNSS
jgi:hypothetical protein